MLSSGLPLFFAAGLAFGLEGGVVAFLALSFFFLEAMMKGNCLPPEASSGQVVGRLGNQKLSIWI